MECAGSRSHRRRQSIARESAEARLRVDSVGTLRQTALEIRHAAYAAMIADRQLLNGKRPGVSDALAARPAAHPPGREFSKVSPSWKRKSRTLNRIARGEGGGRYDQNRVDAISKQVQHSEAAVLRDSYEEMAAEVERLRERADGRNQRPPEAPAGGNGEKAINSETADFVDTVLSPAADCVSMNASVHSPTRRAQQFVWGAKT